MFPVVVFPNRLSHGLTAFLVTQYFTPKHHRATAAIPDLLVTIPDLLVNFGSWA